MICVIKLRNENNQKIAHLQVAHLKAPKNLLIYRSNSRKKYYKNKLFSRAINGSEYSIEFSFSYLLFFSLVFTIKNKFKVFFFSFSNSVAIGFRSYHNQNPDIHSKLCIPFLSFTFLQPNRRLRNTSEILSSYTSPKAS